MEYLKERWGEMSRGRRIILLLNPVLFALSLILFRTLGQQQVVSYGNGYLRYEQQGEAAVYSGKADDRKVKYVVSPGSAVEYWLDGALDSTYTVTEDPTAIPETDVAAVFGGSDNLIGIEIRKDGGVWFRGAYSAYHSYYWLLDENGKSDVSDSIVLEETSAPTPKSVLSFARGPEVSVRGHLEFILMGLLFSAICLVSLLFEDQLFRWDLYFRVRDPYSAEPSEWELFSRWAGWIIVTGAAALAYTLGSGLIHIS